MVNEGKQRFIYGVCDKERGADKEITVVRERCNEEKREQRNGREKLCTCLYGQIVLDPTGV